MLEITSNQDTHETEIMYDKVVTQVFGPQKQQSKGEHNRWVRSAKQILNEVMILWERNCSSVSAVAKDTFSSWWITKLYCISSPKQKHQAYSSWLIGVHKTRDDLIWWTQWAPWLSISFTNILTLCVSNFYLFGTASSTNLNIWINLLT